MVTRTANAENIALPGIVPGVLIATNGVTLKCPAWAVKSLYLGNLPNNTDINIHGRNYDELVE